MPGQENSGWGAIEGVFAESPNRLFIVQRGNVVRGIAVDPAARRVYVSDGANPEFLVGKPVYSAWK